MTKFGEPEPWSPAEVQVFLAKVRKEMADPKIHPYIVKRRVWVSLQFLLSSTLWCIEAIILTQLLGTKAASWLAEYGRSTCKAG